ncbi:hypothetical protein D3C81_1066220 [compost metagenome]
MRRHQHHHLVHHNSHIPLAPQHPLVIQREHQCQGDLLHQLPQRLGITLHQPLALEAGQQRRQCALERVDQAAHAAGQLGQAPGQVRQVLEQEAVLGHPLDDQVQEQPIVLGVQAHLQGRVEQRHQRFFETLEQADDQRFLAVEVVVQVAGADAQLVGDLQRGDVRLALLVEQLQGALKDTVAGLHSFGKLSGSTHNCPAQGPAVDRWHCPASHGAL